MRTSRSRRYQDVDLSTIDLINPVVHGEGEPHLLWEALRERSPCHWHEKTAERVGYWSVTRYEDCQWVLNDHKNFTSEQGTLLTILGLLDPAGKKQMAVTDPPAHGHLRRPLVKALNQHQVVKHSERIRKEVRKQFEPMLDGETVDFAEITAWLSMGAAAMLLDLPQEDWSMLTQLTNMSIAPSDQSYRLESGTHATMQKGHRGLFAYFTDIVEERRKAPGTDVISTLLSIRVEGKPLDQGTIISNCYSLLLGANVTTPHVPTATVLELASGDRYDQWLDGLVQCQRTAIDEALRWSSPASHFMRYATKDLTLQGQDIKKGDAVVAWIGSANRDDRVFEKPFEFNIWRRPNKHITFGYGPHLCVGHVAARQTLDVLFNELFTSFASIEVGEEIVHLNSNFIAGIKSMQLSARPHKSFKTLNRAAS